MLVDASPIIQALLGTLLTWGLTAAGSLLVIVFNENNRRFLDTSLGFAAGVMIAASYWSLLDEAIELATLSKRYGDNGEYAFVPVAFGFLFGAVFVYVMDIFISKYSLISPSISLAYHQKLVKKADTECCENNDHVWKSKDCIMAEDSISRRYDARKRRFSDAPINQEGSSLLYHDKQLTEDDNSSYEHWKRMLLLIVAITVHNVPEGLAVGVAFGAIGMSPSASFQNARNLAIGIGIQNFPEGLAVSLPLKAAGFSTWRSFWYGQLSGMVEPISGLFGVIMVSIAERTLPYALSFAAGAMIYVVVDDIIPEANTNGNGKYATWGCIIGFLIMMALDVGLG